MNITARGRLLNNGAARLLQAAAEAEQLAPVDTWLNSVIRHAWFPNPFVDGDFPSGCSSKPGHRLADLYMNRDGRNAARREGIHLEVGLEPPIFLERTTRERPAASKPATADAVGVGNVVIGMDEL